MRRPPLSLPKFLAVALCALLLAACSPGSRDADSVVTSEEMSMGGAGADVPAADSPATPPIDFKAVGSLGRASSADVAPAPSAPDLPPSPSALTQTTGSPADPSMIVRTGESHVQVDSLEQGIAAVQRTAAALGGWVAHSTLSLGDRQPRSARLEVKLPSERWQELLAGLEEIGMLQQLTTSTEDVGEQFVDLSAQRDNAGRLEDRYLELLATRTGSLEDLLAIERELARVRERIEMLEGRLRYLTRRVAISTMTIALSEPADLLAIAPGSEPLRDAFRAAWQNFLAVITGGIALLGGALPLAALLTTGWWGWRWARGRRRTD